MKNNKNIEGIISISVLAIIFLVSGLLIQSSVHISYWFKLEQSRFKSIKATQDNNVAILEKLNKQEPAIARLECISPQQLCSINAELITQQVIPDWEHYFKNAYECKNKESTEVTINDLKSQQSCLDLLPSDSREISINSNYQTQSLAHKNLNLSLIHI